MDTLIHDLRYALRQIARRPAFSAAAVLVLALGIGAASAIFSVLDHLLLRSLPYEEPERVVTVWERNLETGAERGEVAPANFFDWREQATVFDAIAGVDPWSLDLTGTERPEVLLAARVTEGFFRALGARALHGRGFLPEEFVEGNDRVVVLGHSVWERRFGADPGIVGRTVELDAERYTVVGVLPPSFQPRLVGVRAREAWIPLVPEGWEREVRDSGWWNVVARLRPGVSPARAQVELDAISNRLAAAYPETNRVTRAHLISLRDHLVGDARTALFLLQGAVGFLLLIACANVASLLLARGTDREREFAIRGALGAARWRLARQLLAESGALAIVGCVAGVALAHWIVGLIASLGPADIPRLDQVAVDGRILAFALGLAGLTAGLAGLAPAIHFSRPDLRDAMSEGISVTAGHGRKRLRGALVVLEVALALVLVAGAGLLGRSFSLLLSEDPGFDRGDLAVVQLFAWNDFENAETPEKRRRLFADLETRLREVPGARAAGAVSAFPLIEANMAIESGLQIEGRPAPRQEEARTAYVAVATPDYFRTMGIPLRAGRFFEPRDDEEATPVALVTESLARRYWNDESPVGRRIAVDFGPEGLREVVGVVGDVRHEGLDTDPRPEVFLPHRQYPYGAMTLVVRTAGDPEPLLPSLQEAVWSVNPRLALYRVATVDELVAGTVAPRRFNLWLLGSFGLLALVLAAIGIYGVIAYATRSRTREIGVRLALGAARGDILREVVTAGLKLAGLGTAIGLAGALGLTRLLEGLLYGVSATDPLTFLGVALLLLATAGLASWLPARRAARLDPVNALRHE